MKKIHGSRIFEACWPLVVSAWGGGFSLPVLIAQKSVMRAQTADRLQLPASLYPYSDVIKRTKYALPNKEVGKKYEGRGQLIHAH